MSRLIKLSFLIIASFLLMPAFSSAQSVKAPGSLPYIPKPVPAISVYDENDRPLSIASLKGQVVLLNFWATWCAPCVKEMPDLELLQKEYAGSGLVVIAASQDAEGISMVHRFFKANNLSHLKKYTDKNSGAFSMLQLNGLPATVLIDANGMEAARISGFIDWTAKPARTVIEDLLRRRADSLVRTPS